MFKCAQTNLFNKSKIIPTKKTTCDICLEEFKNIKNTPCKVCKKNIWYICNNCYQKNKELNGKCPVCRTEYVSIDIIESERMKWSMLIRIILILIVISVVIILTFRCIIIWLYLLHIQEKKNNSIAFYGVIFF